MNPPIDPHAATNAAPQLPFGELPPPKDDKFPLRTCRYFYGIDGRLYGYQGKFHLVDVMLEGMIEEEPRP